MQHSFQFLKRKYQPELFSLFIFLAGKNKDNATLKATGKDGKNSPSQPSKKW